MVHRRVGVLEQRLEVAPVLREQADTDAGGHEDLVLVQLERWFQRLLHAPRDPRGVLPPRDVRDRDDELVPPQPRDVVGQVQRFAPRHGVAAAEAFPEALRHPLQKPVPRAVPERVVDLLEPIEIEEEDREAAFPAPGILQRQVELLHEQTPVRQERQTVVVGQETDLPLDLLQERVERWIKDQGTKTASVK